MLFHRFAKLVLRGLLAIPLDCEVVGLQNVRVSERSLPRLKKVSRLASQ